MGAPQDRPSCFSKPLALGGSSADEWSEVSRACGKKKGQAYIERSGFLYLAEADEGGESYGVFLGRGGVEDKWRRLR